MVFENLLGGLDPFQCEVLWKLNPAAAISSELVFVLNIEVLVKLDFKQTIDAMKTL